MITQSSVHQAFFIQLENFIVKCCLKYIFELVTWEDLWWWHRSKAAECIEQNWKGQPFAFLHSLDDRKTLSSLPIALDCTRGSGDPSDGLPPVDGAELCFLEKSKRSFDETSKAELFLLKSVYSNYSIEEKKGRRFKK